MRIFIADYKNRRQILDINEDDYVRDIKEKIEKKLLYNNNIIIHYNGEILEDDEKISSYDIEEYSTLIFMGGWRMPEQIKIIIVDSEGYNEKFNNNNNITIYELKNDLRTRCGIKSEIKLFYEGNILYNDDYTWDICEDSLDKGDNLIIFYDGKFKQK